jgi:deoxyribodipyrimidine photo-lyase
VWAQRWSEPLGRERDRRIATALGTRFRLFEGELLQPPGTLRTGSGRPYSVFTHFARAFEREANVGRPLPAPRRLDALPRNVSAASEALPTLEELGIAPNPKLIRGGETAARRRLRSFLNGDAEDYQWGRDVLGDAKTSRLSADLKFGCLSAREAHHRVGTEVQNEKAKRAFQRQLVWREFSHHTLWDRPSVLSLPFRKDFLGFPWRSDAAHWQAWVDGKTGYPIVDAAARQLRSEGFVHNRARMIAASFLCKHLLLSYREGERHYLELLVDGDWAQNNMGWQWSAGTGSDAQPYFRVFNPKLQGQKFDPSGSYVRRWVPELARVPDRFIHCPSDAQKSTLLEAGVRLGIDYPPPIVDHRAARERFLAVAKRHLSRLRAETARRKGTR